jgi:glycosyltransferase involved in cell wall biosynthesis
MSYLKTGKKYDVMRITPFQKKLYREYEGISVYEGDFRLLAEAVYSGKLKTIALHFLDVQMWNVINPDLDKIRLFIWIHGADIHPYWRREHNYNDENERKIAKIQSDERMKLWSEVFEIASSNSNIHFIFVSKYSANEVMEDYKITLKKEQFSIIHNAIDTDTFDYVPKSEEQRKRIFSLRPWSSKQYANDISISAILELSKHKEFEDMEFFIAGQGRLFDELTEPLTQFPNVKLEKSFYTHKDIADLHKEYGVCLIPTRGDTQGVSRDEAMSSGLVPITNAISAIPEFCTNEEDSLLVPAEDYKAVADAILRLYRNPKLFTKLSKKAAERVRKQSAEKIIIPKELDLIEGK